MNDMRKTRPCPSCGGLGRIVESGFGLRCEACFLEWHWDHESGVGTFCLPEKRYDGAPLGGWTLVPDFCLPIIREEKA